VPLSAPSAQLSAAGPVSVDNGFPTWYRDALARQLDLCLTNTGFCLLDAPVTLSNPGAAFPANYGGTFPEEAFFWSADASMPTNGNGEALLVMGLQAAFANGLVAAGDQITFGRLRIRVDNLQAGGSYRVTTPFGVFNFVAANAGARGINFTRDIGGAAGDFVTALNSGIGPFLRWDTGLPLLDGAGNEFIGNPNVLHTVTGSPTGNNFFQIDGPSVGGPGVNRIRTNLFAVSGQVSKAVPPVANFTATPTSGAAPLTVQFTDTSTGAITSRAWSFGDGATSTLTSPSHVYTATGSFTASLTVTGPGGSSAKSTVITVGATPPPTAPVLSEPNPGRANNNNTFTVTGTSPNGLVFLLGSTTLGTSRFTQSPCGGITTGLNSPTVLANTRASGTTATFRISINGSLAGRTFHVQAIDMGRCAASNVNSHVY